MNRLHDRKTEHFKALTQGCHASALADHVISTGHNIKWDHFEIIATGKSDLQCRIKDFICSSSSLLQLALFDLKKTLLQNGYPRGVLCYNINHVLNRQKNKPAEPITTVPKKD